MSSVTLIGQYLGARERQADAIDLGLLLVKIECAPAKTSTELPAKIEHFDGLAARVEVKSNVALAMVKGGTILCRDEGRDAYRRVLATCRVTDGEGKAVDPSLNERLVLQVLAVSFFRFSHRFDAAESAVRAAHAGMWSGTFEMPWDYRASHQGAKQSK